MTDIIKSKTTAELQAFAAEIGEAIAFQKATLDNINAELLARYGQRFADELAAAGKTDGEVSREIDGVKMTFAIKPKVKWDGKKLEAIAASLPWNVTTKVFKIEFTVPERTFKAMTDDGLLAKLNEARTVEYSEPKVVFAK